MDHHQHQLPDGWKRLEDDTGSTFYLTRHPEVKISKRCQLESYQKKGRYLEMNLADLDFGTKRRSRKYSAVQVKKQKKLPELEIGGDSFCEGFSDQSYPGPVDQGNSDAVTEAHVCNSEEMEDESEVDVSGELKRVNKMGNEGKEDLFDEEGAAKEDTVAMHGEKETDDEQKRRNITHEERKRSHLENEERKLVNAVQKLTLNRKDVIDHREALDDSAKNLKEVRSSLGESDLHKIDLDAFKSKIDASKTAKELVLIINSCTELQQKISSLEQSKILEQLLKIASQPENPLTSFPLDINKNHYSDIISFALKNAPDVMGLVLRLSTKNEAPITHNDVVRCAYMFSSLACSVSRLNNALKKTKSVNTKNNGLTNNGLDLLANIGVFETSRTYRNDRDFLASLSEHILKSYAQISVPQITFDNMDMSVGNVKHHMTLPFFEFETEDTSHLPIDEMSFEEALEYFRKETVLLKSALNEDLFEHYKYVTCWTLARIFGEEVEGFAWMKKVFPCHYKHPNSETSCRKSTIFTQKPLNFNENNNREMIQIMTHLQFKYLSLVGEQSKDKDVYFKDLKMIYSVDLDDGVRVAAEERIKEEVVRAGELVCHGDLLTDVRFETCKRLRRMAVTAVERFDFLKVFRLGTFHLGMNKVIQDIQAGMKSEVNVEDTLSLGYFKTILGLHHITNNPDVIKKDGNYEPHAQFCDDIGRELLIEAFKTFIDQEDKMPVEKTEDTAVKIILEFLETMDIKYFYDHENYEEKKVHDDMMTAAKDNASRTLISLVLHSVEHEGDGLGLRALRTVMIPYMLNRKEIQDSKYAPRLLFNRIWFIQASKRTQARIDMMACCNPSGKPGHSIARDMENEHKVKSTKNILRGLHSQLGDLTVEKSVLGSNILNIIESHDREAMMLLEEGGKTSYRYLSTEQKTKIRQEIRKMKPFEYNRGKVDYFDKTRSVFSGLPLEQIERFLLRNKLNFSRNSPHKAFLVEKNQVVECLSLAETDTLETVMMDGDSCEEVGVSLADIEQPEVEQQAEQESDESSMERVCDLEMNFGSDEQNTNLEISRKG